MAFRLPKGYGHKVDGGGQGHARISNEAYAEAKTQKLDGTNYKARRKLCSTKATRQSLQVFAARAPRKRRPFGCGSRCKTLVKHSVAYARSQLIFFDKPRQQMPGLCCTVGQQPKIGVCLGLCFGLHPWHLHPFLGSKHTTHTQKWHLRGVSRPQQHVWGEPPEFHGLGMTGVTCTGVDATGVAASGW